MKNKKIVVAFVTSALVFVIVTNVVCIRYINRYKSCQNNALNAVIYKVQEKYPEVSKNEIMEFLSGKAEITENVFEKYGIDLEEDFVLLKNEQASFEFVIVNNIAILLLIVAVGVLGFKYYTSEQRKISQITKCLERINAKDYSLSIKDNVEGELSILKNELYKTAIMLKEQADISTQDKRNIKMSLEDISHQLKTPLTSINILLDNILDNPEIPTDVMFDFIKDIKKEIVKINVLIESLLKLSRFDVNAVIMQNAENNIREIVKKAVENVAVLCDLKAVKVVNNVSDTCIVCDFNLQVEAITNIVKNCVEHSQKGGTVTISFSDNKIYSLVTIEDTGEGIAPKDIPHIFDRFYKASNANKNSVGIGLALAKSIIEKSNGKIDVDSKLGEYTKFEIRYFK